MAQNKVVITIQAKDAEKTKAALRGIGVQTKQMGKTMSKAAILARNAFLALGATIGVAGIVFGIKKMINTAIQFEGAFAGVRKTVDATEKEFKQLEKGLIAMSKRIPVSAKELAGIQEIAGQLGVRGVDNLTQFTEAIAKIAVTTNLTQEAAAIGFARIAAVIGEPISNIEKMASSVVDLGNKFEVNEQEILTFSQRIAGMGKVAGLTVDELFGIGAAFASVGIQAEAGGTAVNKVLLDLTKQSKRGGQAFIDFVTDLEEAGDDAAIILEQLGFKQARTQRAFLSLAGAGGKLEKAMRISNVALEDATALNIEAEKRFETTESKMILFKNAIDGLSLSFKDNFLPSLAKAVIGLTDWINKLVEASEKVNELTVANLTAEIVELSERLEETGNVLVRVGEDNIDLETLIQEKLTERAELIESMREAEAAAAEEKIAQSEAILDFDFFTPLANQIQAVSDLRFEEAFLAKERAKNSVKKIKDTLLENSKNEFIKDTFIKGQIDMWKIASEGRDAFSKGMSMMAIDLIEGNKTIKESFEDLGKQMIKILLDWIIQTAINAALSKAFKSAEVSAAFATGTAIATAMAPAAAATSLATSGANAIPAAAGIASTHALSHSLAVAAEGGDEIIRKPTLILAGEAGAERVQVQPLRRGGEEAGGGNGMVVNITINNPTGVIDDELMRQITEEVSFALDVEASR